MKIKTEDIHKIKLNGIWGNFYINNANVNVHYFSSFASPDTSLKDGHRELLDLLKPMREIVKDASKFSNLDSLLQRDLNDERIAHDLIPYLKGVTGRVGFFPPVLVVLMPKDYLNKEGG